MCNCSHVRTHLAEKLYAEIKKHKNRGADWENTKKVYHGSWIDNREEQHYGIKCTGSSKENCISACKKIYKETSYS